MADMSTTLREDLEREILEAVRGTTTPLDALRVAVRIEDDHDGDSAYYVDIWDRLSPTPIRGGQMIEEMFAVRDLLHARGDFRFPYIRRHFNDRQQFGAAA